MQNTDPHNPDLSALINAHLRTTSDRISPLTADGQVLWIKRVERPGLIRRLQKGNPMQAFERERLALQHLTNGGLPVPRILAQGANWFAINDVGKSLSFILRKSDLTETERLPIFAASGHALASLHNAGISHGRPNLKDICWDGETIRFLDFERYAEHRNTPKGHVQDVLMFVFNTHALARATPPELDSAINAYRAEIKDDTWERTTKWCHTRRWIVPLMAPIRAVINSREYNAIPMTFSYFANRK